VQQGQDEAARVELALKRLKASKAIPNQIVPVGL
jgi:hypothetical protein